MKADHPWRSLRCPPQGVCLGRQAQSSGSSDQIAHHRAQLILVVFSPPKCAACLCVHLQHLIAEMKKFWFLTYATIKMTMFSMVWCRSQTKRNANAAEKKRCAILRAWFSCLWSDASILCASLLHFCGSPCLLFLLPHSRLPILRAP